MAKNVLPAHLLGPKSGEGRGPHATSSVIGFGVAAMQMKAARDEIRDATLTPDSRNRQSVDDSISWVHTGNHTGDA